MPTFTDNLRLTLQDTGSNADIWGDVANAQVFQFLEDSVSGVEVVPIINGVNQLTNLTTADDQARKAVLVLTGMLTSPTSVDAPSGAEKVYLIRNTTTGTQDVTVQITGGGGLGVLLPQTGTIWVYTDGTDFYEIDVATAQNATTADLATDSSALGGVAASSYARLDVQQGFTQAQDSGRSPLEIAGSNVSVNAALSNSFYLDCNNNFNLLNPTNGRDGQMIRFFFVQDAGGSKVITWGSQYKFPGGNVPILSTAGNTIDYAAFEYRQAAPGPIWIGNLAKAFA